MFRMCSMLLLLLCAAADVFSNPSTFIEPCKKDDENCMIQSANSVIPQITSGIPSLDIEVLDPLNPGVVESSDPEFTFKFTNNTVKGFKSCNAIRVKLNLDKSKLNFTLKCPTVIVDGHYDVIGEVLKIPINVSGQYKVVTGRTTYEFAADIDTVKGSDEVLHLAIKKFTVVGIAEGHEIVSFDKPISPDNQPANVVKDFNRERDKEVIGVVKPIYVQQMFEVVISNVNKLLGFVPYDDLFI